MTGTAQRNTLRFLVALGAVVPVAGGLWGVLAGLGGVSAWSVDHYRYLSGLLLAIGLGFWSTVPNIERRTQRFRLLTGLVVIGGLCRLLGVALGDPVTPAVVAALAMELVATPALCLWQAQVSITK
ncbi:MAG TPA: DUF4345 domain-containing protein [Reyranella sp.]|jgi:hypothetical protein